MTSLVACNTSHIPFEPPAFIWNNVKQEFTLLKQDQQITWAWGFWNWTRSNVLYIFYQLGNKSKVLLNNFVGKSDTFTFSLKFNPNWKMISFLDTTAVERGISEAWKMWQTHCAYNAIKTGRITSKGKELCAPKYFIFLGNCLRLNVAYMCVCEWILALKCLHNVTYGLKPETISLYKI